MTASDNVVSLPCLSDLRGDYFRWNGWMVTARFRAGGELRERLENAPPEFWRRIKRVRASGGRSWRIDYCYGERAVTVDFSPHEGVPSDSFLVGFFGRAPVEV